MKKVLPLFALIALAGGGCLPWSRPFPAPAPATEKPSAQAPATPIKDKRYDACVAFTKADAEAVIGMKVNEPLHSGAATEDQATIVSSCSYASGGEMPTDVKVASLLIRKAATVDEANRVYDQARAQSRELSGVDPVDVADLGDRAYWSGGSLTQLNVLTGDAWLIINIQDTKSTNLQQQATEAARRALDKMKK